MTRTSYRDRVAQLFRDRPNQLIDGLTVAKVGGAYGWRTRISECRRQLGMAIENRKRKLPGGTIASEYCYVRDGQES